MDQMRQYLLSVIVAALICAIIRSLLHKKGASSAIINLIASVFMVLTLIGPWTNIDLQDVGHPFRDFATEADVIAEQGVHAAQEETAAIIKEQTQTYIEDKAKAMGADVQVEVSLGSDGIAMPESVMITGTTSPYVKAKLSKCIAEDIGIPEAAQKWN